MKRKERKEQEKIHDGKRLEELDSEIEVIKKEIEKQKLLNQLEELKQEGQKNRREGPPPITIPIYPRDDTPIKPYFDPDWYKKGPWCGTPLFTHIETTYETKPATETTPKKKGTSYARSRKD